eukprot:COSAG03_NODE_442_length_7877_cov_14.645024_2_plen_117_part_00
MVVVTFWSSLEITRSIDTWQLQRGCRGVLSKPYLPYRKVAKLITLKALILWVRLWLWLSLWLWLRLWLWLCDCVPASVSLPLCLSASLPLCLSASVSVLHASRSYCCGERTRGRHN